MKKISKILAALIIGGAISNASIIINSNTNQPDPFANMDKLFQAQIQQMEMMQAQMDKLFQNFEKNANTQTIMNMPIIVKSSGIFTSGLQDKGKYYELKIRLNNPKNSKVEISTQDNLVTISISEEKKIQKQQGNYGKIFSYSSNKSVQSFTLPPDADPATIKATQKGDTIILTIQKKKPAKVIPIKKETNQSTSEHNNSKK